MGEFGGEVTEKDVRSLSGFLRRSNQEAHAIVFSSQVEPKEGAAALLIANKLLLDCSPVIDEVQGERRPAGMTVKIVEPGCGWTSAVLGSRLRKSAGYRRGPSSGIRSMSGGEQRQELLAQFARVRRAITSRAAMPINRPIPPTRPQLIPRI
jgi:hypothetical protein